jgi:hypothetical protein
MGGRLQLALGFCLLAIQLAGIAHSRTVQERYFCWAPYDIHTSYSIQTRIDGRDLSASEIRHRYNKPKQDRDNRSPFNVIDVIRRVERMRVTEAAEVRLRYRVNGKAVQVWRWPER